MKNCLITKKVISLEHQRNTVEVYFTIIGKTREVANFQMSNSLSLKCFSFKSH